MFLKQYSSVVKKQPNNRILCTQDTFPFIQMFGKPKKRIESQKKRIERTWRKKESLMATIKKKTIQGQYKIPSWRNQQQHGKKWKG